MAKTKTKKAKLKAARKSKPRSFQLSVTEVDIANGEQFSESYCPIALALIRKTKGLSIEVLEETLSYQVGKKLFEAELPESAMDFVYNFDHFGASSEYVNPFKFTVRPIVVREAP